jgi:hypothetical protein
VDQLAMLWAKGGAPMYPLAVLGLLSWTGAVIVLVETWAPARRASNLDLATVTVASFGLMALGWAAEIAQFRYDEAAFISRVPPEFVDEIRFSAHAEVIVDRLFGVLLGIPPLALAVFSFARRVLRRSYASYAGLAAAAAIVVAGLVGLRAIDQQMTRYMEQANSFPPRLSRGHLKI